MREPSTQQRTGTVISSYFSPFEKLLYGRVSLSKMMILALYKLNK
jgi:hypothetical protein